MAPPNLSTLISGVKPNGVLTLDPPRKEFQGPIVIKQPMTIQGQGSTIWAECGPVVVIESPGVILKDLNIEVTGGDEKLSDQQKCALVARGTGGVKFDHVSVRGDVDGVPGEDRGWRYPRILRLHKLKAGQEHQFRIRLAVPVPCRIESGIVGVELSPRDLKPGLNEVLLKIERLAEGIRLRGTLTLVAGPVNRRVELSGHITSHGAGISSGMGQLVFEVPDSISSVPAEAVVPTAIPSPTPVVTPPSAPPKTSVTSTNPPSPTPVEAAPITSRPISRLRKTDSLSPLFGPPPENEPDSEPVAEQPGTAAPPPEDPPSSPIKKKPSMRRTDGLGGLFGN